MTELIVLRILGDVCLYFSVVGSFPLFFAHDFTLLYPALLCAAGVGVAQLLEGKWLRYLALVLPLVSLLPADELMEYLILGPAVAYTGAVICMGAFELEYYSYRDLYFNAARLLAVFGGMVFAMGYFEGMAGSSWEAYDISSMLLYGLIFVLSGIFLLRQLRLGADCRPRDRVANNVQMVVVLAAIVGLSFLAVALEESLQGFFNWALNTLIGAIMIIPMIVHEIMRWFLRDNGAYFEAVESVRPTQTESVEYTFPAYTGPPPPPPTEEQFPWWLAILVLALLCLVFFLLLRTLGKGRRSAVSSEEPETVSIAERKKRENRRSNRGKVRKLYRDYLKLVRRKGQRLETWHTTADILKKRPQNMNTEAADRLRQVYLKARYDTENPVTDAEAEQAKAAMKAVMDHHKGK